MLSGVRSLSSRIIVIACSQRLLDTVIVFRIQSLCPFPLILIFAVLKYVVVRTAIDSGRGAVR